ncbi:MAG TPA: hypothetical protein VMJ32_03995 [Pirellulales bacterium]|nr:hypothetical protein [Pirellulales bacterium]
MAKHNSRAALVSAPCASFAPSQPRVGNECSATTSRAFFPNERAFLPPIPYFQRDARKWLTNLHCSVMFANAGEKPAFFDELALVAFLFFRGKQFVSHAPGPRRTNRVSFCAGKYFSGRADGARFPAATLLDGAYLNTVVSRRRMWDFCAHVCALFFKKGLFHVQIVRSEP